MTAADNPVRALLGRGSVYSVATAFQLASSVLFLPVITRLLSTQEYGTVALAVVVQTILGLIGAVGFPEVIPRTVFFTKDGAERARMLVLATFATAGAAAGLAVVTGDLWCSAAFGQPFNATILLGVVAAIPQAVMASALAILRAEDRASEFVRVLALATVGAQVLGLAFLLVWRSPAAYMSGTVCSIGVGAILAVTSVLHGSIPRLSLSVLRESLRTSLATVPHGLAFYVLWAGDRAVIAHVLGASAAGRYQVAYTVGGLPIMFVSAAYNAWGPIIFRSPEESRWKTLAETSAALHRITSLLAACTGLVAAVALTALVPAQYHPRSLIAVSAVVALASVPFVAYCAAANVVLWRGRTELMATITPLVAVLNIALNIALVPRLGLIGAAWSTLSAYSVQAFLMALAASRVAPVRWELTPVLTGFLTAGGAVGLTLALPYGGGWSALRTLLVIALIAWLALTVRRLMSFPTHEGA